MTPMVEAIRKYAPASKIVLGGYGTVLGDQLKPYSDYICQGEGVEFMRNLLGEPVDAPIEQPIIIEYMSYFLPYLPVRGAYAHIFAGLGCPNGCEFCATSAYYKRRHIKLLPDGPSVVRAIERVRERHPEMTDFWVTDEDFLLNTARGKGFLEALRASDLPPLSISIFSSVKALSQYTALELVEMGIERVWVGFEAKGAGYDKMKGRSYKELFNDLHNHGIAVLASMIIGYDYQTKENIMEEFDELMNLRPSTCQFLILSGPYGTPLHSRLLSEGRYFPEVLSDTRLHDGFLAGHSRPNISAEELNALEAFLCKEELRRLGPTMFRFAEDFLTGYENLKDHPNERVRAKAQKYLKDALLSRAYLQPSKKYLSPSLHPWIDNFYNRLLKAGGEPTAGERLIAATAPAVIWYANQQQKRGVDNQPRLVRREFPEKQGADYRNPQDVWTLRAMKLVRNAITP
jgi:haloalkane dehalogenase